MAVVVTGVVVLVVTTGVATPIGSTDSTSDEPPLADAGLDQTVPPGTTVYLDGGGSVAPDGEIVSYEWEIEQPDGSTIDPCDADNCVRPSFLPTAIGQYNVTLTVTDDEGRTAEDTLYVTVTDSDPPSATLTGPDTLSVGETGSFILRGSAGDAPLSTVHWLRGSDIVDSTFVDGGTEWTTTLTFDDPGTYVVSGRLTDVVGLTAEDSHTVTVESEDDDDDDDDEEPYFAVSITATDSPVSAGESLGVEATVENTGGATDTQNVTLEAEFADDAVTRSVGSLSPGDSVELTTSFDTDGVDPGRYNVSVVSEDDSDSRLVRIGTDARIVVTDISPVQPEAVDNPYRFSIEVENTGDEATAAAVQLQVADVSDPIGGLFTDEIPAGEVVELSDPIIWNYGSNGWHEYDGERIDVRATTSSWEDAYEEPIDVPQLPTYELGISRSNVRVIPDDSESAVTQVAVQDATVTNVGDFPGDATARLSLLESAAGDSTGVKDETDMSIGPGESYVIDQTSSGLNELFYNPLNEWEDDVTLEVDVYDDLSGVHDSETFDRSWVRSTPGGGGDPCETGENQMEVETNPSVQESRKIVEYDVYLLTCEDQEEGRVNKTKLDPSQYTVEYAPQSPGPREYLELRPADEEARGTVPDTISRDRVELGWRVEHKGSDVSGYGGAIWEKDN